MTAGGRGDIASSTVMGGASAASLSDGQLDAVAVEGLRRSFHDALVALSSTAGSTRDSAFSRLDSASSACVTAAPAVPPVLPATVPAVAVTTRVTVRALLDRLDHQDASEWSSADRGALRAGRSAIVDQLRRPRTPATDGTELTDLLRRSVALELRGLEESAGARRQPVEQERRLAGPFPVHTYPLRPRERLPALPCQSDPYLVPFEGRVAQPPLAAPDVPRPRELPGHAEPPALPCARPAGHSARQGAPDWGLFAAGDRRRRSGVARVAGTVEAVTAIRSAPAAALPAPPGRTARWSPASAGVLAAIVACALFFLYAYFGTAVMEGVHQRSLSPAAHMRIVEADAGIDELVLPTDSRGALASGPGLVPGSGVPGSATPIVIVGHRTTNGAVFSHLSALRPDQLITLHDVHGSVLQYRVERVAHVAPDSFISEAAGPQALYLVTGSPPYLASGRLVVVARLLSGATTVAGADQSVRIPSLRGSRTDLALALVLLAGLAWAWAARRRLASRLPGWAYWGAWAPAALVALETSRLLLAAMSRVA